MYLGRRCFDAVRDRLRSRLRWKRGSERGYRRRPSYRRERTATDKEQTDNETAQERAKAGKESKDGKKGKGKKGNARAQEATLEMSGDVGTEFYGSCTVGDQEMEVSGQVPESFSYERLECEISKESAQGDLEVAFTAGNNVNSVKRISGGTLKLVYENGRLSSSTSSGSGASSSSSQGVSSQGGSSSS